MKQEKPAQALSAFKHSLELYPKRFNSLLGAARAAQALEDKHPAKKYYAELLTISISESKRAGVQEARKYIAGNVSQRE